MEPAFKPTILAGIIDHFDPEVQAMMIAMYSRNYGPILSRMPNTEEEHASLRERLKKFYVGYGHKSVGQLGVTTIFFEGVSQLAAKAIEDCELFNGQESSTRYIDFSTQPNVVVSSGVDLVDRRIGEFQETLRQIYVDAIPMVIAALEKEFPYQGVQASTFMDGEDCSEYHAAHGKWKNTIKARAFDICRSILPGGSTTNVAFQGTFDTLNDHFGAMLFHPSEEMRTIAQRALNAMQAKYPDATPGAYALSQRFGYMAGQGMAYFYNEGARPLLTANLSGIGPFENNFVRNRSKWEHLPKQISKKFTYNMGGFLDFGSFRDLQRHRNGTCLMPLLTADNGLESWYVRNLPRSIVQRLEDLISEIKQIKAAHYDGRNNQLLVALQYAVPMGCRVSVDYQCDYNQLAYITELRTGKTVHQTLRHYMQAVHARHEEMFPALAKTIFPDMDEENFTLKRGEQTFTGEFALK